MAGPRMPSNEERDEYYLGLAGKPRLVARTSQDEWSLPARGREWDTRPRKRYAPVLQYRQPEIVSRWSKDLTLALVRALKDCSWTYFYPIRIGRDDTIPQEYPTILLIAVENDSLQWDKGISIALKCRTILRDFKIADVEVEIREGKYTPCAAFAELERQIDPQGWTNQPLRETNKCALPMLSSLGHAIGYAEERVGDGSLGLYIRLGNDTSPVYGLTCRHVVHKGRSPTEAYVPSEEPKQYHVRGSDRVFRDFLGDLEQQQVELERDTRPLQSMKERWEQWYIHDESLKHKRPTEQDMIRLAELESAAAYNKRFIELFKNISDKKDRQIGHLAFLPKLELSSDRPGYLKDWALIELDLTKFNGAPGNKVFIGNQYDPTGSLERFMENGFLSLRLKPQDLQDLDPKEPMIVGKRGFKTGLTYGRTSSIEAVVRHPTSKDGDHFAWEMLIVPVSRCDDARFSAPGDSGSCVFDMHGNVVGIVSGQTYETSGDGQRHWGYDVTFATPIRWVLEDIQRFTGLEPRLA
ncbi:hypothetical protein GGR53DRAFT_465567 [Hypoxylon sp. FL1150]|nr:hypothetical protein GGR53DRAFT_465567 [Hypoxylon sp. FL1150]